MFQNVFKIAAGLIFVVAVVTSMFAVGSAGRIGFEHLMGVDNCYYARVATPEGSPKVDVNYEEQCKKDTANNDKRTAADSLAMLLVALPTAVFFYKKVRE